MPKKPVCEPSPLNSFSLGRPVTLAYRWVLYTNIDRIPIYTFQPVPQGGVTRSYFPYLCCAPHVLNKCTNVLSLVQASLYIQVSSEFFSLDYLVKFTFFHIMIYTIGA